MSASSQTIVAALPPSSSTSRLAPAARATAAPVAALPGEADHRDLVRRAELRADVAAAVQQLDRRRPASRRREQRHDRGGDGGRLRRRLDDGGVAGRERGAQLVRQQVRWRVERGDRERDADRGAVGQRGVADAAGPARHRQQLAADPARLRRADREGVRHPVDLAAAVLDRLAQLERDQGRERFAPLRRQARGCLEHIGAGGRGDRRDRRCGVPGEAGRRRDVGGGCRHCAADHPPHVRAGPLRPRTVSQPLARDERRCGR